MIADALQALRDFLNDCLSSNDTRENKRAPLPSNARYCTHCGGVSAFYHAQLLSDWQSESPPIELPEPPEDPPDFDIFG